MYNYIMNNMSYNSSIYKHYETRFVILIPIAIMLIAPNYLVLGVQSRPTSSSTTSRRLLTDFTSPSAAPAAEGGGAEEAETKWAVLVAGSKGYDNYRHQADICHAYQILKNGGLKDENIVVLMYDDIALSPENPYQGVIVNKPGGQDVYEGVPKDYTGEAVTGENLVAVILGEEDRVQGGSGKVVKSGPNDHIFIYYADHGGPGVLSMPAGNDLYANDFIDTLQKKYTSGTYKSMVVYVEACESGSIFDGLLSTVMNIYVTTASNPTESSYGTYCPGDPSVPSEYRTCLGDLYSVSWMEDSDQNREETLDQQYEVVKSRTRASHVMQYGDSNMGTDMFSLYIGSTMNNAHESVDNHDIKPTPSPNSASVEQPEADINYLQQKVQRALPGSQEMVEAQKKLDETIAHRKHVDRSVAEIGKVLFGAEKGHEIINIVRPAGKPLVDDWDCLKALVSTYKTHCGLLSNYGKKYMRAFANMCNAGIRKDQMTRASSQVCN